MPIPWLAALKVIPKLVAGVPAIVRAADTLLSGTRARPAEAASAMDVEDIAGRVAALERHDQANAELTKQVIDQVAALATATEVIAARLRWLTAAGVAAVVLAMVALLLGLVR